MDLLLEAGLIALRVAAFVFVTVGAVTLGAIAAALLEAWRAMRESGPCRSTRLPGIQGIVFGYDSFSRALVVGISPAVHWRFQWRRVGACNTEGCGDGPDEHRASMRGRILVSWCVAIHDGVPCECKHYSPERRGAVRA
jgi:hypothetical protein